MIGFQATVPPVFGRSPLFPSNVSVGVSNGVVSGYNGHSVLALNGSIHGPSLNGGSLNGSSSSSNGSSPLSGSPTNGMTVPVPSSHHRSSIVATPPNILDYYPGLGGDGLRISWYHAANSRSSLHAALTGNWTLTEHTVWFLSLSFVFSSFLIFFLSLCQRVSSFPLLLAIFVVLIFTPKSVEKKGGSERESKSVWIVFKWIFGLKTIFFHSRLFSSLFSSSLFFLSFFSFSTFLIRRPTTVFYF